MSKLNGKSVSYGALHGPIFTPEVGQMGPTLTKDSSGHSKGVKMTIEEPFVVVEVKNKNGKIVEIAVPITNFSHMVTE
jgi:hypothetical protein